VLPTAGPSTGGGRGGRGGGGRGRGRGGRGRGGSGGQEGRAAASLPAPWGAAAAAAAATPGGSLGGLPALRLGTPTEAEARAALLAVCPTAPPSARLVELARDFKTGQIAAAIAAAGPGATFAPAAMYADVAVGWLAAGLEDVTLEVDLCLAAGPASAAGPLPVCHFRLCGPPSAPAQSGALGGGDASAAASTSGVGGDSRGGGRGGNGSRGAAALEPAGPEQQGTLLLPPRPLVPPGRVALPLAGLRSLVVRGSRLALSLTADGGLRASTPSLAVIDHALLDHLADAVGDDGDRGAVGMVGREGLGAGGRGLGGGILRRAPHFPHAPQP
jgi:hypothetical protein